MSNAEDFRKAYVRPEGRTEREVAAETVARLLKAKVVPPSAKAINEAALATGVSVEMIRQAWATDLSVPFTDAPAINGTWDPEKRCNAKTPTGRARQQAWNDKQKAKKEPVPGKRLCSRCKQLLDKDLFRVKIKRTGQLQSWCIPCYQENHRLRYLSSERVDALGPILRLVLQAGDAQIGVTCPDCNEPCLEGQEVVASDSVMHHASHH